MKIKLIASLKIWVVIYPSITMFYYFLGEQLSTLPLYIRTLLLTATLVPWMVFIGVPLVDTVIRSLLGQKEQSQPLNKSGDTTLSE